MIFRYSNTSNILGTEKLLKIQVLIKLENIRLNKIPPLIKVKRNSKIGEKKKMVVTIKIIVIITNREDPFFNILLAKNKIYIRKIKETIKIRMHNTTRKGLSFIKAYVPK